MFVIVVLLVVMVDYYVYVCRMLFPLEACEDDAGIYERVKLVIYSQGDSLSNEALKKLIGRIRVQHDNN